ncbi:glycoside hydrolase family 16 protein [Crepidotus variabilis]|uniref:Glycoside hydrolase family 16 protein n=1 Tax=Crepidotus variabilis TaxID=179855 RepID=A0A9P6ESP8_9AGAR|nr:glycoside hydrolase family 16 protein [Crepidotus variabilis]
MSIPGSPAPGYSSTDSTKSALGASQLGFIRRESWQTLLDSPYGTGCRLSTLSEKYSLSPDIRTWGADLSIDLVEADDHLHNPPKQSEPTESGTRVLFSRRGLLNVGCILLMCSALLTLFIAYPILTYPSNWNYLHGYNIGGINGSGQVPLLGNFGLIDLETPKQMYTRKSLRDDTEMVLVFSDEFNEDGRSFYPGDDPYWQAEDMHYWSTNNMEWYDPGAVTTAGGALVITFSEIQTHDLNFQGALISTWNKFCFTGGYIEAAVQLPGANNVIGMWPAIWTMGNLGRAGYGASLEGMWPYTYDACDVGTAPNQTVNGVPALSPEDGDHAYGGSISYLPGQKLSRCTCNGEDHPGPKHPDGTYVGRSAPEIDLFEAQMSGSPLSGEVSQSAQWAPFNRAYIWDNSTAIIEDPSVTRINGFKGNVYQQATSLITKTNQRCYELEEDCFSIYGFEYKPGYDEGYITWVSDNQPSWTLTGAGIGADNDVQISARQVTPEPMYIIVNLGMSKNFGSVDFEHLTFPTTMRVDYIRVYQDVKQVNIGCDPKDYPTAAYIQRHTEAYTNANLTTWSGDYGQPFPKNSFVQSCT